MKPATAFPASVQAGGKAIEVGFWPHPSPRGTVLLIHEALGSVSYWKDFPRTLGVATEHTVIAYSRAGHGDSEGPVEPRSLDYYRRQVDEVIPALLDRFDAADPVLYGHSEGAGIAMLYAAAGRPVRAIVAECPIVVPEERTAATIRHLAANYAGSDMGPRLARYHAHPDEVFHSWIESSHASFSREHPFEAYLQAIRCPILVLQGSRDEFAGELQYRAIHRHIPHADHAVLEAGHLLHRERPDEVAARVAGFLRSSPEIAAKPRSSQPSPQE